MSWRGQACLHLILAGQACLHLILILRGLLLSPVGSLALHALAGCRWVRIVLVQPRSPEPAAPYSTNTMRCPSQIADLTGDRLTADVV